MKSGAALYSATQCRFARTGSEFRVKGKVKVRKEKARVRRKT